MQNYSRVFNRVILILNLYSVCQFDRAWWIGIWKKAVVAYFKTLPNIRLEVLCNIARISVQMTSVPFQCRNFTFRIQSQTHRRYVFSASLVVLVKYPDLAAFIFRFLWNNSHFVKINGNYQAWLMQQLRWCQYDRLSKLSMFSFPEHWNRHM